ncbi:glucokinase [Antarcticimicrobium sediminis]|nr:glucokinase [Antarcticimicrobium sediminis]
MTILLADMGGTTTRLALLRGDGELQCTVGWSNDKYDGPGPLLLRYLRQCGDPALRGACIAIAGPVGPAASDELRLSNRDWHMQRNDLIALLRLPGQGALRVVNDLTALALALPELTAEQIRPLRPLAPPPQPLGNGQALVANCGTGFNVGLVKHTAAGPVTWEAELGHAALSATIVAELGAQAAHFPSIESLFSGPGLSRLHAARQGGAEIPAPSLVEAAGTDTAAQQTVTLMARLMGLLARDLIAAYLPRDGFYWAGSMARGVLGPPVSTPFPAQFLRATGAGPLREISETLPLWLITEDAAALCGLARLARADQ